MTDEAFEPAPPRWTDARTPRFVREWSTATMGHEDADPVDYLDQDPGVGFTIAAAWLFCPETVEYRGGVFLKRRFAPANVDHWLERHGLVTTQATVNLTKLWSVFTRAESQAFDDRDELQLIQALGECWYGVLRQRHPEHRIFVSVDPDEDETGYGPSLTVWSAGKG